MNLIHAKELAMKEATIDISFLAVKLQKKLSKQK